MKAERPADEMLQGDGDDDVSAWCVDLSAPGEDDGVSTVDLSACVELSAPGKDDEVSAWCVNLSAPGEDGDASAWCTGLRSPAAAMHQCDASGADSGASSGETMGIQQAAWGGGRREPQVRSERWLCQEPPQAGEHNQ